MFKKVEWKCKVQGQATNSVVAELVRQFLQKLDISLLLLSDHGYIVHVCVCTDMQNFWNFIQLYTCTRFCRYLQKYFKILMSLALFTFWLFSSCFCNLFTGYWLFSANCIMSMWVFFRVLMAQILEQKLRKAWEEAKATRGQRIPKTAVWLLHVSSKSVSVRGENVEAVLPVLKYALKSKNTRQNAKGDFKLKCRLVWIFFPGYILRSF